MKRTNENGEMPKAAPKPRRVSKEISWEGHGNILVMKSHGWVRDFVWWEDSGCDRAAANIGFAQACELFGTNKKELQRQCERALPVEL